MQAGNQIMILCGQTRDRLIITDTGKKSLCLRTQYIPNRLSGLTKLLLFVTYFSTLVWTTNDEISLVLLIIMVLDKLVHQSRSLYI